jgi:hypothetical protein
VTWEEIDTMFSNVEDIWTLSKVFLEKLEQRARGWQDEGAGTGHSDPVISDILLETVLLFFTHNMWVSTLSFTLLRERLPSSSRQFPMMRIYYPYCYNRDPASVLRRRLMRTNPLWQSFVRVRGFPPLILGPCHCTTNCGVHEFAALPEPTRMQQFRFGRVSHHARAAHSALPAPTPGRPCAARIGRLLVPNNLFQELLKYTAEGHVDKDGVSKALGIIASIAEDIDGFVPLFLRDWFSSNTIITMFNRVCVCVCVP